MYKVILLLLLVGCWDKYDNKSIYSPVEDKAAQFCHGKEEVDIIEVTQYGMTRIECKDGSYMYVP